MIFPTGKPHLETIKCIFSPKLLIGFITPNPIPSPRNVRYLSCLFLALQPAYIKELCSVLLTFHINNHLHPPPRTQHTHTILGLHSLFLGIFPPWGGVQRGLCPSLTNTLLPSEVVRQECSSRDPSHLMPPGYARLRRLTTEDASITAQAPL